jgi:hypothetical protein
MSLDSRNSFSVRPSSSGIEMENHGFASYAIDVRFVASAFRRKEQGTGIQRPTIPLVDAEKRASGRRSRHTLSFLAGCDAVARWCAFSPFYRLC